jgi:hypothetical protein
MLDYLCGRRAEEVEGKEGAVRRRHEQQIRPHLSEFIAAEVKSKAALQRHVFTKLEKQQRSPDKTSG